MSVLEKCPCYRESNKGSKQRQGPTLGVRLIEVSVKRESTVFFVYISSQTTFWAFYGAPKSVSCLAIALSYSFHSAPFQSFILNHLEIASVHNALKLPEFSRT